MCTWTPGGDQHMINHPTNTTWLHIRYMSQQAFPIQAGHTTGFCSALYGWERLLARECSRTSSWRSQTIPGEAITNVHLYNIASLMPMYQWTIYNRESLILIEPMRTLEAGQKRKIEHKNTKANILILPVQYSVLLIDSWLFLRPVAKAISYDGKG